MTPTEYRQSLRDSGWTEPEADQIVRLRQTQNRIQDPGQVTIQAKDGEGEILIYEAIGFDMWNGGGLTPKKLTEQLAALGKLDRLTLRVNSPGGDVFDALTMFNILRRQEAKITVEVEGLAASAAGYLAQVADPGELRISEAGMFMVHRAWALVLGNTKDMLDMAGVLEKMDQQIAGIYAGRSRRALSTWLGFMDEETWFTGQEAVDAKLADNVIPAKRAAACLHAGCAEGMRNVPTAWLARVSAEREALQAEESGRREKDREAVATRLRLMEMDVAEV